VAGPSCLPLVVEVVETEEKIQEILPALDRLMGGGLVTLERVRVILYRPATCRRASVGCTGSLGSTLTSSVGRQLRRPASDHHCRGIVAPRSTRRT
jgi:hypothetical protein